MGELIQLSVGRCYQSNECMNCEYRDLIEDVARIVIDSDEIDATRLIAWLAKLRHHKKESAALRG